MYRHEEDTVPIIIGTDEHHVGGDEVEYAGHSLREHLALFEHGEESCASGLIRLLRDSPVDPAGTGDGLVADGGKYDTIYDYGYTSEGTMTRTSDGQRNSDNYDRQQQQQQQQPGAFSSSSETAYGHGHRHRHRYRHRPDDAVRVVSGGANAVPSPLEAGHDGNGNSGAATFLRSSRHAAATAAAHAAHATAAAAAAAEKKHNLRAPAAGHELEGHSSGEDGDDNVPSASAAEAIDIAAASGSASSAFAAQEAKVADYPWPPLGSEDFRESDGDGYAYYQAEVSRFSEDARAASASAHAAAYASATAVAAAAAKAASADADAADVITRNGVSSPDEARAGGDPHMSHNDGEEEDGGGLFFGKTRRWGFWQGVGDGVALAES